MVYSFSKPMIASWPSAYYPLVISSMAWWKFHHWVGDFPAARHVWWHRRVLSNVTIWLFNIAMENDPFIDDVPIKMVDLSMAMLVITRWYIQCYIPWIFRITPLEYPMTTISRSLWLYLVIKHYQTWLAGRFPTSMVFPTIKPPLSSGMSHHFPIIFQCFPIIFPSIDVGKMPAIRDPKPTVKSPGFWCERNRVGAKRSWRSRRWVSNWRSLRRPRIFGILASGELSKKVLGRKVRYGIYIYIYIHIVYIYIHIHINMHIVYIYIYMGYITNKKPSG